MVHGGSVGVMLLHGWALAGLHGPKPGQGLAALHDNGFMRHIMSWSQRLAPAQWGMPVLTLAIWVALGWSGSAWVLRALQPPPEAQGFAYATTGVAQSVATGSALVGPEAARLMGAPATTGVEVVAAPNLASRLKLVGVASAGAQRGAALIGIDGQAPKPYQIGREVVDGLVLQSVDRLGARLGAQVRGPSALQLDMPLPRQP